MNCHFNVILFSPFKQAQRFAGGTGLGLFSLARRVEALKGAYGVKKRRDEKQGALFWFTIPYRPDPTAQLKTQVSSLANRFALHQFWFAMFC